MATEPARFRPKSFPPPEFPPRQAAKFARMPPAIFPVILGAIGLVLALRRGFALLELPQGPVDLLAGLVLSLWVFAAFAYAAKLARRPSVLWDDLKVLPGRAGLAAATVGGLAVAALLVPYAPGVALYVLYAGLGLAWADGAGDRARLDRLAARGAGREPGLASDLCGLHRRRAVGSALGARGLGPAAVAGDTAGGGGDLGHQPVAIDRAHSARPFAALAGHSHRPGGAVFDGGQR